MLAEYKYDPVTIEKGYANQTLYINLSDNKIESRPVTKVMKDIFVGGRGFGLYLLWHSLPKDRHVKWSDPENCLCIASGPLGGTTIYPGSGKSIVTTLSPLTDMVIDSNVGGYFGPFLKFAGWDALQIQGKAKKVIIVIDGDERSVVIESATAAELPADTHLLAEILTERYGGKDGKKHVAVVSSGTAAVHTLMGCLNFSWYDSKRDCVRYKQAGRGGSGTVLSDKGIVAIVCKCSNITAHSNNPADERLLMEVGRYHTREVLALDPKQNEMRVVGTTHIVSIMNEFDTLPVHNFKFGSHPETDKISADVFRKYFTRTRSNDACWLGCSVSCSHCVDDFELKTGPFKGQVVQVDGPEYETIAGAGSNCGIFDPEAIIELNFYCDTYGLDTISFATSLAFVMECYECGILSSELTGGLELRFGNKDAALELLHRMARDEGFGRVIGLGIRRMKKLFVERYDAPKTLLDDIGMEAKGLEFSEYVTKESLAQQGGYGLALKGPQHDEAWLIFLDMVHNLMPTFEQKAENLYWFPMFRTWFGLNGLCKLPWNDVVPEDNAQSAEPAKVMRHVESYAKYFTAVTGREATPDDLIRMSERVYNFQRMFNLRMGFGTRAHDAIPYRAVGPVTAEEYESRSDRYDKQLRELLGIDTTTMSTEAKLERLREHRERQYERLCDAVYKRRGWSSEGVPTLAKLRELGIDLPDVVALLGKYQ